LLPKEEHPWQRNFNPKSQGRTTHVVSHEMFKQVYDSAHSLSGKHRWVTKGAVVQTIEKLLLGIPEKSIGAPHWARGSVRDSLSADVENGMFGTRKDTGNQLLGLS
jgi:hypothetical protein